MDKDSTAEKLEKILLESKESGDQWIIESHSDPDPDAIASTLAAKKILDYHGIKSVIAMTGEISRASNKALKNRLEIEDLIPKEEINCDDYKYGWIVDATNLNVKVNDCVEIKITTDHHDVKIKDIKSDLKDIIEKDRGSTATRMTEYLQMLNIPLKKEKDSALATALYYGIYTDTGDMIKGMSAADLKAASYLIKYVDKSAIEKIAKPDTPVSLHKQLNTATKEENMIIEGVYLFSFAGTLDEKEHLGSIVDGLVRTQGIETAFCYGILDNNILVSIRTRGNQITCGQLAKKVWPGNGGGKILSAGAKIPLGYIGAGLTQEKQEEYVQNQILDDLYKELKIDKKEEPTLKPNGITKT